MFTKPCINGVDDMHLYTLCIIFLVALFCAGLCAFLETASTALRLFQLKELAASENRYKHLFSLWIENPKRILVAILIANNFAHVLTSILVSEIMQRLFGSAGVAIGVATATVLILIFGEIIPKSFAQTSHRRLFRSCLWLINAYVFVFRPMISALLKLADRVFGKIKGIDSSGQVDTEISEKEIKFLIDYASEKNMVDGSKMSMLRNVFGLGHMRVKEIMVPKNEIIALDISSGLEAASTVFHDSRYSRLPVYEHEKENIIGFVHQKDIFEALHKEDADKTLKSYVRPIMFIPETQRVNQLLNDLLLQHRHMATVLSEHGVVTGLVTLEDILEEIVGDIADEYEQKPPTVVRLDEESWSVMGSAELKHLEEVLKVTFTSPNSVTLGGFLAEHLQHVPKKGECMRYKNYCFHVQQANARKVIKVLVFKAEGVKRYAPQTEHAKALRSQESATTTVQLHE